MSRRLVIRPEAEQDMVDAFDGYEDRVPGLGHEFLPCVHAVLGSILRTPERSSGSAQCVRGARSAAIAGRRSPITVARFSWIIQRRLQGPFRGPVGSSFR